MAGGGRKGTVGFNSRRSGARGFRRHVAWIAFAAAFVPSCASTTQLDDQGFRHGDHGYRQPHPADVDGVRWHVIDVVDAHVAYRGSGDAFMALDSRCANEEPDPAVLGRQLLVGIDNRHRLESDSFAFAGGRAYAQLVETNDEAGGVVRTRTVTLVRGGCVIDWVLAVEAGNPAVESAFERWWRGFEPKSGSDEVVPGDALVEAAP